MLLFVASTGGQRHANKLTPQAEEIIERLDTRCYPMSGRAHRYNLDLPETMAVREKLLPESGAISQVAMLAAFKASFEKRFGVMQICMS